MPISILIIGPHPDFNPHLSTSLQARISEVIIDIHNGPTDELGNLSAYDHILYTAPLALLEPTANVSASYSKIIERYQQDRGTQQAHIIQCLWHSAKPSVLEQEAKHYFDGQLNILPKVLAPTGRVNQISTACLTPLTSPLGSPMSAASYFCADVANDQAMIDYVFYLLSATALTGQNFSISAPKAPV